MKRLKIDYLYIPSNKQIYPKGTNKKIKISAFRKKLCGAQRPGHFEAIVDVIERFIKIIHPKKIYLGEKDMQQLKIIENFVKKKYTNVKIVGCKTIREKNGVAYSSGLGNDTRGLYGGGTSSVDVIDYITIATIGNATDFGNLSAGRLYLSSCASTIFSRLS